MIFFTAEAIYMLHALGV